MRVACGVACGVWRVAWRVACGVWRACLGDATDGGGACRGVIVCVPVRVRARV